MSSGPGWYEDPQHPGWRRWWDGTSWTEHRAPAPAHATPSATSTLSVTAPRRRVRAGVVVSAAGAVAVVTVGVVAWVVVTRDDQVDQADGGTEVGPAGAAGEEADAAPTFGDRVIGTCDEVSPLTLPGTDISIDPLSRSQEADIGISVVDEVMATSVVADDPTTQVMLDGLLDELRPSDDGVDYRVTLLESEEVIAFAVPGGSLFLTTAITDLMTTDELAFVMGHEIAHVHCRHAAQQIERVGLAAATANAILGTDLDAEDIYADAAGAALADLASLSFSRDDELEADLASLDLLEGAGRPLGAGADALRRLLSLEGTYEPNEIDVLLSTHPPTRERIDAIEAAANGG